MASLPALTPTAMSFSAPEFPVKANTSLSGVVSRRLFGNRGSRATLGLTYSNIPDASAAEFLTAWNASKGTFNPLTVPSVVFDGRSAELTAYLTDGGDDLIWHFAERPDVEPVVPGVSTVKVALEATRDA